MCAPRSSPPGVAARAGDGLLWNHNRRASSILRSERLRPRLVLSSPRSLLAWEFGNPRLVLQPAMTERCALCPSGRLEQVNLANNALETLTGSGVDELLPELKCLQQLDLRGNGLCRVPKYRDEVILLSESLGDRRRPSIPRVLPDRAADVSTSSCRYRTHRHRVHSPQDQSPLCDPSPATAPPCASPDS